MRLSKFRSWRTFTIRVEGGVEHGVATAWGDGLLTSAAGTSPTPMAFQAQLGEGFDHFMPLHGGIAADRNGRSRRMADGGWRRARASDVVIGAGAGDSRRLTLEIAGNVFP